MEKLKKDNIEIDDILEEISNVEVEEKVEDTKKEEVKQENTIDEKTENIEKNVPNKQGDFKESFDKFITKKNLLEYIMGGISALFILSLVFLFFKMISLYNFVNKSTKANINDMDFESALSGVESVMSGLRSFVAVINVRNFIGFLIFLSLILMGLLYYKLVCIKKRNDFFKLPTNLSFVGGILAIFIGNLISRKFFNLASLVKKLTENPLNAFNGKLGFGDFKDPDSIISAFSMSKLYLTILFYIIGIIAFGLTIYMLYLVIFKNQNVYSASENIKKATNSAVNSGVAGAEAVAEKVKTADYSVVTDNVKKNKKYIISGILGFIIIVGGIFGYKTINYMLKPDAVISLENMDMTLNISGYDGYGVVKADVSGVPTIKEVKDKKKYKEINSILKNYKVEYSKEKEIKNGDEITATLKFEDTKGLKLKFDKKELSVTAKANNLVEFVRDFKDVEKHLNRMEEDAKKVFAKSSKYSDAKNLKIERIAIYDMPLTEETINSAVMSKRGLDDYYKLCIVYKITGENKEILSEKLKPFEDFKYYEFKDFKKRGEAVTYSTSNEGYYVDKTLDDIENGLQIIGYKKVKK